MRDVESDVNKQNTYSLDTKGNFACEYMLFWAEQALG